MEKNTETLRNLHTDAFNAEYELRRGIVAAVIEGMSWAQVGEIIGTSKQTAYNRYNKHVQSELTHLQWEKDHPEQAAAAAARGAAEAAEEIAAIHAKHDAKKASKNLDGKAPAKVVTTITGITVGPPHTDAWTDPRPGLVLKSAGMIDGVAQPGTGKGPHQCRRCGSNNHKSGKPDVVYAYADCGPTKYDPQDITDYLNSTGLSKKA